MKEREKKKEKKREGKERKGKERKGKGFNYEAGDESRIREPGK